MKISLQIILADARSPGRGLPPQPFDRHISGELPNLDNIIQESESQYGDSARADTIQLPRAARAASARGRSLCRARGQLSLLKVWASRSHRLELGLWPRSGHPGLTTQGAPIAQVSGFWPRGSLSRVRKLSPRSDPTSQSGLLLGAPGPRAQASRVPRKLPPAPRADPSLQLVSPRLSICPRVLGKGSHSSSLHLRATPPLPARWPVDPSFLRYPALVE